MNNDYQYYSDKLKRLVNFPNKEYFRLDNFTLSPNQEKPTSKELKNKRILLFRSPGLGDVIMTTPAITTLKKVIGSGSITLLTSHQGAKAAPLIKGLDDVITMDAPWDKLPFLQKSENFEKIIKQIRKKKFDIGIILTVVGQDPLPAALIMYLAGVPRRIAYSRYKPYQLLTDWIPDYEPDKYFRHEVDRELELLKTVGVLQKDKKMNLQVPKKLISQTKFILTSQGVDLKRPIIVCHIGSTDIKRVYPPDGYLQIARDLTDLSCQVIFTGVENEKEIIEEVVKKVGEGAFNFAGLLNFEELTGLIKICDLLISNNTSPVHIASCVGTRVLDLYARTNPQHIPWLTKNKVLYFDVLTENRQKILKQLPPRVVTKYALKLLAETNLRVGRNHLYGKSYHPHSHL